MLTSNQGYDAVYSPPRSIRVLCVDDNHDIADSTATFLRLFGFEAMACYDGITALTVAPKYVPNIFFIDLTMPGMEGDELVIRLREECNWQPKLFVAVTAMTHDAAQERIKKAGFHLHLVKPVDPYTLVGVVNALCRLGSPEATAKEINKD
ncbi:MAG: response regulator [Gemmatales bacterium]